MIYGRKYDLATRNYKGLGNFNIIKFKKRKLENKIHFEDLNNFKTIASSLKHSLLKEGILLPDRRRKSTSVTYMN